MIEKKDFFPSIFPQKGKLLQNFEKKSFFELVVRAFLTFSWNGARWLVGSLWQRVADWLIRREQIFCHHDYTWPAKMIFLIFFSLRERATPRREKMKMILKIQSKRRMVGLCRGWTRVWVSWQESGVFCCRKSLLENVNFF